MRAGILTRRGMLADGSERVRNRERSSRQVIDRRAILKAAGAVAGSAAGRRLPASAADAGLMLPERIEAYPLPGPRTVAIEGRDVAYALAGPAGEPLALYFHGWGDDFRVVLPLEYTLADAGFRLLVPNRPGYGGTALDWITGGKAFAWRTASDTADVAARLLDRLRLQEQIPPRVAVIGMSGGAPAALAFASRHPARTAALLIQAGVTQPWTDARYVPELLRGEYITAFERFGWAGDRVSQLMFGLLARLRETSITDADKVKALSGERLASARADPAYQAVIARLLREDPANRTGEINDAISIFFSRSAYCDWDRIEAPTLLIHDEKDPFVPIVHAREAKARLRNATLSTFALGGHILWLGSEARRMHEARVEFLRRAT
jgi:pimeloyl-ACP methyl ester carboxylesterase